jgi:tetratricopeptide (TPR) repeat protein
MEKLRNISPLSTPPAWGAIALVGLLVVSGCAAPGPTPQRGTATEIQDEDGFTITEEVRVSPEVRADFERAMSLLEQERYEQGIALLVAVTERAPAATAAHIDLGIAYREAGKLEEAETSIRRALELNPRHPVAHNELGMLYRRTGRFGEARMHYERALEIHPAFHYARRNLAVLCDIYLADLACALRNYELYTEAVPGDEEAAMWIADLRNRTGLQGAQ